MVHSLMITAHSGCDNFPANSAEYISRALTLDIDALEIDIRRNVDGRLILTHNPPQNGKEYMTLHEAFDMIRPYNMKINCDMKEPELEHDILRAASDSGIAFERVIFTGTLTDWRKKIPSAETWLNPEEILPDFYSAMSDEKAECVFRLAAVHGYRAVNIDFHFLTEAVRFCAGKYNLALSLWTIDDPSDIPQDISRVINITTNYPSKITA